MLRLRRLALVAVLALTGGLALAGCQPQPGLAAYVGDKSWTDADIDQMSGEVAADVARLGGAIARLGDVRRLLVENLVAVEITKRRLKDLGIAEPPVDFAVIANEVGLPGQTDDPYVQAYGQRKAFTDAVAAKAVSVEPTEAELRGIYDRYAAATDLPPFEIVKADWKSDEVVGRYIGLSRELASVINRIGAGVSPRYATAEVAVLVITYADPTTSSRKPVTVIALPLAVGNSAVTSIPATAAPASN